MMPVCKPWAPRATAAPVVLTTTCTPSRSPAPRGRPRPGRASRT
ncbi:hypothetical protein QJS66_13480 [Kocuria rhizophila]|nr:hypothetical protein QJS66_13480 [Kocuria rhizophila]